MAIMINFPVKLPDELKADLAHMVRETEISQSTLIRLATLSLVANYKEKGSFIFADLLNPDHKGGKKRD